MAKIGNEAKLILKLANERSDKKVAEEQRLNGNSDYYKGYRDAKDWIFSDIAQICINLEENR